MKISREIKEIERVKYEALHNLKYRFGIKVFEKNWNIIKASPQYLTDLGLMYDHLVEYGKKLPPRKIMHKNESKALELYRRAIKIDPKFAPAWWGMARVWWHRHSKKALPYAKKAYKVSGSSRYLHMIALVYEGVGQNEKAEKYYLESRKKGENISINYAIFLNKIGRDKEAKKEAKNALKIIDGFSSKVKKSKGTGVFRKAMKEIINSQK